MIGLVRHGAVVATDSGGVHKEAFFHRIPRVTMRDETEWTELVEAAWNHLVPRDDPISISNAICEAKGRRARDIAPYGQGYAVDEIGVRLRSYLS